MKKEKIEKTNAARHLDKEGINYQLIPYQVDENDLSAIHVAAQLNEPLERVFKTLVLKGDKSGYFVCVIPADAELDLKHTAAISGNKSCDMIAVKDLFNLTGYIRGGCSPLGLKKPFPVFIDETSLSFDYIFVSAGRRGLQIKIDPSCLVKAAKAEICKIIS